MISRMLIFRTVTPIWLSKRIEIPKISLTFWNRDFKNVSISLDVSQTCFLPHGSGYSKVPQFRKALSPLWSHDFKHVYIWKTCHKTALRHRSGYSKVLKLRKLHPHSESIISKMLQFRKATKTLPVIDPAVQKYWNSNKISAFWNPDFKNVDIQ